MMMQQPNQYFEQLGADKDLGNRALILRPAPDVKHLPPDHLSPAAPCSLVEELHSCPPPLSQVFGQAIEISALGHWPSAPRNWEDFVLLQVGVKRSCPLGSPRVTQCCL